MPMGYSIRHAGLIAIADTTAEGTFVLGEILKGDAKLRGQRLTVPPQFSTADVYVPRNARGIAVLLDADRKRVLEIYTTPDALQALRTLIGIYELPSERARLTKLRELAFRAPANSIVRNQLWADFHEMREPANFALVTEWFARADERGQESIVGIIDFIGDPRGIPTLEIAKRSPHKWVASKAEQSLRFRFPSGPQPEPPPANDYQRISRFREAGDEAAARALFLRAVANPEMAEALVRFDAEWVERMIEAHPPEGKRIRAALLPVLTRYAQSGDYLQAASAAQVLRGLKHPDTVRPLLALLGRNDRLYDKAMRIAAFALADLGGLARKEALEKVRPALRPLLTADVPDLANAVHGEDGAWAIYRLGRLRDKRAIAPIVAALQTGFSVLPDPHVEALIRIGGPETETAVLPLLRAADRTPRDAAIDVLVALQGRRVLPLLRRMLTEKDFGVPVSAASHLGRLGDPSDIAFLLPYADFWTGDRVIHYHLTLAVSELRRRHGYDMKGPVR